MRFFLLLLIHFSSLINRLEGDALQSKAGEMYLPGQIRPIAAALTFYLATSASCSFVSPVQDGLPFDSIDSVVRIRRPVDSNRSLVGSGFIIGAEDDKYLILSNDHVTRSGQGLRVDFFSDGFIVDDDQFARAESSYLGDRLDVSITKIPKSEVPADMPSVKLAPRDYVPKVGDKVISIGCSEGRWPRARVGHVDAISGEGFGRRIVYSPNSIGGDSGGILLDGTGTMAVGLVAWTNGRQGMAQTVEGIYTGLARASSPPPKKPPSTNQPRRPFLDFWRSGTTDVSTAFSTDWSTVTIQDDDLVDPFEDLEDKTPRLDTPAERHRLLMRLQHDCERIEQNQKSFFPLLDNLRWFVRLCFWLSIGLLFLVLIGHPATSWVFNLLFGWISKGVKNIGRAIDKHGEEKE